MTSKNTKSGLQELKDQDLDKVQGAGAGTEAKNFMSKKPSSVSTGAQADSEDFMSRDKTGG